MRFLPILRGWLFPTWPCLWLRVSRTPGRKNHSPKGSKHTNTSPGQSPWETRGSSFAALKGRNTLAATVTPFQG